MAVAYIGLGSNLGDSPDNLRQALRALNSVPEIVVDKVAGLYKTAPVGYTDQAWFYNTVARIQTTFDPHALLALLLQTEDTLGRVRNIRWGPRTVDLDLLLYEDLVIDTPALTVPHPRMLERAFVLVPLSEIAPGLVVQGQDISSLAKVFRQTQEIVCVGDKVW